MKKISAYLLALCMIFNIAGSVVLYLAEATAAAATEAASGTVERELSSEQEKEMKQRLKEIDRIAAQTQEHREPGEEKQGILERFGSFIRGLFSNDEQEQPQEQESQSNADISLAAAPTIPDTLKTELHFNEKGVNLSNGNYSRTDMDLEIYTPAMPFHIKRSYNSLKDHQSMDLILGPKWTFNFNCQAKAAGTYRTAALYELPDRSSEYFSCDNYGNVKPSVTGAKFIGTESNLENGEGTVVTADQYEFTFYDRRLKEIKDPDGNVTKIGYTNTGSTNRYLISYIDDPQGGRYNFTYQGSGLNSRLTKIVCPDGREVLYTYDQYGGLIGSSGDVKEPRQYTAEIIDYSYYVLATYDGQNNLLERNQTIRIGNYRYDYTDEFGNMFKVTKSSSTGNLLDVNLCRTTKNFDNYGYVTKTEDPMGNITKATYHLSLRGKETSITDRYNNKTEFERDSETGNITKCIQPDGSFTTYVYNAQNNVTQETDEVGASIYYVYDSTGKKLLKKAVPLNGTDVYSASADQSKFAITEYVYYSTSELPSCKLKGLLKAEKDPEGKTTVYGYDNNGNNTQIRELDSTPSNLSATNLLTLPGKSTTKTFNTSGQVTSVTDPTGVTTTYAYNDKGLLISETLNGTDVTSYTYDYAGRVSKIVAPQQNTGSANDPGTMYTYYPHGKVASMTDPEGNTTSYTYDVYGNLTQETRPDGVKTIYTYDRINRLIGKYIEENGVRRALETYRYDLPLGADSESGDGTTFYKNEKVQYDGKMGAYTTKTIQDSRRRTVRTVQPDGTTVYTAYNADGTKASVTDAKGYRTLYKYNGLKLETERRSEVSANLFSYLLTSYDNAGRVVSEKTGKEYVSATAEPSTQNVIERVKTYYLNGLLNTDEIAGGKKTVYEYDSNKKLTKRTEYLTASQTVVTTYSNNYQQKRISETQSVSGADLIGGETGTTQLTTTYTYDKNGNLKTVTTPDGVVTTNTYDRLNRLVQTQRPATDEYGNSVVMTLWQQYDAVGNIVASRDAEGNITTNRYDILGNLIRREKRNGAESIVTASEYDLMGRVLYEVSPNDYDAKKNSLSEMSHIATLYDAMGRPVLKKRVYPQGEQVVAGYQYDAVGNVTKEVTGEAYAQASGSTPAEKLSNAYGRTSTYDGKQRQLTMLDAESAQRNLAFTVRYTYDGADRKIVEESNLAKYEYAYDSNNNITAKYLTEGSTNHLVESATYNLRGDVLSKTDGNGNTTTYTYNSLGLTKTVTQPGDETIDAYTKTTLYDTMKRAAQSTDSLGAVLENTYNNLGKVTSVTSRNESATQLISESATYDLNGNPRFQTDGNGNTTELQYDGLGRNIAQKKNVGGVEQTLRFEYDKNNNLTKIIDWLGNITENIYDKLNRVVAVKDAYGKVVRKLEYNADNIQTKQYTLQDYNNYAEITYEFDQNNRLIKVIYPEGNTEQHSYNDQGLVASKTDGLGNITEYGYDAFGHLTSVTDALEQTTQYTYDYLGNLLSQTDSAGRTESIEYNARNLAVRQIDPDGKSGNTYVGSKVIQYTYYANGALKTKNNRGSGAVTYTYDIHGRNTGESAGTIQISRTYDANGNELSMTDATGTTQWTYDELNRTTTKTVPEFGTSTWKYDIIDIANPGGVGEKMEDPDGNVTVKEYDKLGRIRSVRDGNSSEATVYTYDGAGRQKRVEYENGAREEYAYNGNNQLVSLKNYQGTQLKDSYSYTYDANGNQLTASELVDGESRQTSYAYDALNRLTYATEGPNRHREYTYNAAGNRATEKIVDAATASTETRTYTYDTQNRLTAVASSLGGSESFSYDAAGNMIQNGKGSYGYDLLGRMTTATTTNGEGTTETTTYAYNGDGQRVAKTDSENVTTRFLYEGSQVVLEKDSAGNATRNIYGLNLISRSLGAEITKTINAEHSVQIEYQEKAYYQYNGHGDVTRLTDAEGTELASYRYDAFGQVLEQSGTGENPYRYAGYRYDEESELYYLNARYYDARIARFMSEDIYRGTSDDPLSLNRYAYCRNNPLRYFDPTGQIPEDLQNEDDETKETLQHYEDMMEANKDNEGVYSALEEEYDRIVGELRMKNRAIASGSTDAVNVTIDEQNKTIYVDAYLSIGGEMAYTQHEDENGNIIQNATFTDPETGKTYTYAEAAEMGIEKGWSGTFEQQNPDGTTTTYTVIMSAVNLNDGKTHYTQQGQNSIDIEIQEVQNIATGGTRGMGDAAHADRTSMSLFDGDGRSDSAGNSYYTEDPTTNQLVRNSNSINGYYSYSMKRFMATSAHEFGHVLGLNDTYYSPGYPHNDTGIVNHFDSIMNNQNAVGGKAQNVDYAILFGKKTWKTSSGFQKYSEARYVDPATGESKKILDMYFTDWDNPTNTSGVATPGRKTDKKGSVK